jgi:hypothetical protein
LATGDEDEDDEASLDGVSEAASALTRGEGTLVGNPAALLSRRRRAAARARDARDAETEAPSENEKTEGASAREDVLDQLRRWKIEMAETFSRLAAERRGGEWDPDPDPATFLSDAGSEKVRARFAPQPPAAPKPPPPRFAPQPPGAPGGPRRPPGRAAAGARAAKMLRASSALAEAGPESGAPLRRRNPRPNSARPASRAREADRLVLE